MTNLASVIIDDIDIPYFPHEKGAVIWGSGPVPAEIAIVGEAPGEEESKIGKVFVGKAGRLLDEKLSLVGLPRSTVYVTNVVKKRPVDAMGAIATPKKDEIAAWTPIIKEELKHINPQYVLLLGNVANKAVTGTPETITKSRGLVRKLDSGVTAFATFHPAAVLRKRELEPIMEGDFWAFSRLVKGTQNTPRPRKHKVIIDIEQAKALRDRLNIAESFSFDLETRAFDWMRDPILTMSFSPVAGEAYVVPLLGRNCEEIWPADEKEELKNILRSIFASDVPKGGQNCLQARTRIVLAPPFPIGLSTLKLSTGTVEIQEIVRKHISAWVWTVNLNTGELERKRIINWNRQRLGWKGQCKWVRIITDASRCKLGKVGAPIVTEDHHIYTVNRGWVEAKFLIPGDTTYIRDSKLSDDQFQVILGSRLGDGSIDCTDCAYPTVAIAHSDLQREYMLWKRDILKDYVVSDKDCKNDRGWNSRKGARLVGFKTHPIKDMAKFDWGRRAVKNQGGTSYVPNNLLQLLGHLGLAIWYMDDGNLWKRTIRLSTSIFDDSTLNNLKNMLFSNFGVTAKITNRRYLCITRGGGGDKFMGLIAPYIVPSMQYKLYSEFRGQYKGIMPKIKHYPVLTKIVQIQPVSPHPPTKVLYDIEVEDNHNFFTSSALVSNCRFDIKYLEHNGYHVSNFAFDTLVEHHLIDENLPHNLDFMASHELGETGYDTELKKHLPTSTTTYDQVPEDVLWHYTAHDADYTQTLHTKKFVPRLQRDNPKLWEFYNDWIIPLERAIIDMEIRGMEVDREWMEVLREEYTDQIRKIDQTVAKEAGREINLNSTKQLREYLFGVKGHAAVKSTASGVESVDEEALKFLAETDPMVRLILDRRGYVKLISTYIDGILNHLGTDGRIHPEFLLTGTVTGRLSSRNPNAQNIPRTPEVRGMFVAPKGMVFVGADFKQLEPVVLGALAGETRIVEMYSDGIDLYQGIAAEVFKMKPENVVGSRRDMMKVVVLGLDYGRGAWAMSKDLKIPVDDAEEMIKKYFTAFPKILEYHNCLLDTCRKLGYVENAFGRRRHLDFARVKDDPKTTAEYERQAINSPVQGTASDITNMALVEIHKTYKSGETSLQLCLNLHDALYDYASIKTWREDTNIMKEIMEQYVPELDFIPRVSVEVGYRWGDNSLMGKDG